MNRSIVFRLFRNGVDDTSPAVVHQFADAIRDRDFRSRNGSRSYTRGLHKINVPILVLAGSGDGFVTESMMQAVHDSVSSPDRELLIVSKANGYSTNYGHCDLLLGRNSAEEVYPEILNWLNQRV